MNPERWQQLKVLFEEAMDKDPDSQAAFLDVACGKDQSLRKEIEALLATQSHDSFLEKPAYEAVPQLFCSGNEEGLVGRKLGPYEIISRLGSGGMGIVYLGHDARLDRQVAIKVLSPRYTCDLRQRERLKIEARAAAKLSHPGIATVFSLEEYENALFLVFEYVQGRTLHSLLALEPLKYPRILDIAIQIARALTSAHELGIIHRDLKPDNVMLTPSGTVKVLDFGLARLESRDHSFADTRLTQSGAFIGTPAYASPEQLLGKSVDRASDIFSFGILLYEMATGEHPFGSTNSMSTIARILEAEVSELHAINAAIPKEFDRIVRRCLQKRPQDRYGSTRDLLFELERLLEPDIAKPSKSTNALWWWQFHQACAGFGYYGMLYPLWRVKEWLGGIEGSILFFPALIAVGISANLRLHLWFTSRFFWPELSEQRRKVSRWIRCADWLFSLMLGTTALVIHKDHARVATLLMSVAIGSWVSFFMIEPTTAKAALDRK